MIEEHIKIKNNLCRNSCMVRPTKALHLQVRWGTLSGSFKLPGLVAIVLYFFVCFILLYEAFFGVNRERCFICISVISIQNLIY